jgi:hypothetical protein
MHVRWRVIIRVDHHREPVLAEHRRHVQNVAQRLKFGKLEIRLLILVLAGCNYHGNYSQIEDSVRMVRSFHEDFRRLWRRLERRTPLHAAAAGATILTGRFFVPELGKMIGGLNQRFGTRLFLEELMLKD